MKSGGMWWRWAMALGLALLVSACGQDGSTLGGSDTGSGADADGSPPGDGAGGDVDIDTGGEGGADATSDAADSTGDGSTSDAPVGDTEPENDATSDTSQDASTEDALADVADTGGAGPLTIVITEIMYDPAGVSDDLGEWVELYNYGDEPVHLTGMELSDSDHPPHVITAAEPVVLAAGAFGVLARSGDTSVNGGVAALYVYSGFNLTNTVDAVVLRANGQVVDQVNYDEGAGWPDAKGASLQLTPSAFDPSDNDVVGVWCLSMSPWSGGDLGSPGAGNAACAVVGEDIGPDEDASGEDAAEQDVPEDAGSIEDTPDIPDTAVEPPGLVITEIMYDPAVVSDDNGEWFEVLNVGGQVVDLNGLILHDSAATNDHTVAAPAPLLIAPGEYALFARKADPAVNGGLAPTYVYGGISFNNDSDSVVIVWNGIEIDRVDYAENQGFPSATGASIQLDPSFDYASDNNVAAEWCLATVSYGGGANLGTPKASNSSCPMGPGEDVGGEDTGGEADTGGEVMDPSGLVITEIMFDPTVVSDTAGEWVELVNTGDTAVDLKKLTCGDSASTSPLNAPGPVIVEPGDVVVVGRSTNTATNGNVPVVATFSFSLNNGKDSFVLFFEGAEIDRVDYDTANGWAGGAGIALQLDGSLDPGMANNGVATSWCNATTTYGGGADLGTPGGPNLPCSGTAGPCEGICDEQNTALGCYCDAACVSSGDCCSDACATCGYCGSANSCAGVCGGQSAAGCFCDSDCLQFNDCCPDACQLCGVCP